MIATGTSRPWGAQGTAVMVPVMRLIVPNVQAGISATKELSAQVRSVVRNEEEKKVCKTFLPDTDSSSFRKPAHDAHNARTTRDVRE